MCSCLVIDTTGTISKALFTTRPRIKGSTRGRPTLVKSAWKSRTIPRFAGGSSPWFGRGMAVRFSFSEIIQRFPVIVFIGRSSEAPIRETNTALATSMKSWPPVWTTLRSGTDNYHLAKSTPSTTTWQVICRHITWQAASQLALRAVGHAIVARELGHLLTNQSNRSFYYRGACWCLFGWGWER